MRAQLVRIGNSQGIRLPKTVIEEAGLTRDLDLVIEDGAVVIRSSTRPRKGWSEAAKVCHADSDDRLEDWETTLADGSWT